MSTYQIAAIVGSLRQDSFNRKLAAALVKPAPAEYSFKQLEIGDLPRYNQDHDGDQAPAVNRLKAELLAAQGLLSVTPEYNFAMPGVLMGQPEAFIQAREGLFDKAGEIGSDSRKFV